MPDRNGWHAARKYRRQSTGKWEWEDAKAVVAGWEQAGSWDGKPAAPVPLSDSAKPERVRIIDATESFIAKCQNRGIATVTLKKYKTFVKQLLAYADSRGYLMLDQLTVSDMDRFYASWRDGTRARAKKLERLKAFIRFCLKREWIIKDIVDDLEAPEGSSAPANKSPFTDEEMDRIYGVCDNIGPPKKGPGQRPWTGQDVKDFVDLSIYTGLRISDAATFNITQRLKGNDVFLRMHKTRKELYTWIPDELVGRLREREKSKGPLIFRCGQATNMRAMSERWRKILRKVFSLAGPWEEAPHHHRFKHTFVRILLEKGVPPPDVAELIGDTEQILRKHYSKWMPGRQQRLSQILKDAFTDKPKLKIVAIR
jgi:site-specific recombinase XerD